MTVVVPERSLVQRMSALDRANAVRIRRAALKRDIKTGRVHATKVLLDPPEHALSMSVWDFLMAIPHWGQTKVAKRLGDCRISHRKTLGGLSERQRVELVGLIGDE